jgi:phosphate transport system protein
MRGIFHQELAKLKNDVIAVGERTEEAIGLAVDALVSCDREIAARVIAGDDEIDRRAMEIEEDSLSLVATQSPVARDLRLIFSILFINTHLERMGDLAHNIAKTSQRMSIEDRQPILVELISEMGRQTQGIVHAGLKAFSEKDLELARALPQLDQPIDELFKRFFQELAKLSDAERYFEWASNVLLACRYLERIADHAVDIGERVSYLFTGKLEEW